MSLGVAVPSTYQIATDPAQAEPILGSYEWAWAESGAEATQAEFYYEDGMVKQRYTPFPMWYRALQNQPMVRINEGWFIPSIVRNGKILEMASDFVFEFTIKEGKAVSFEIRDDRDNLLASGKRLSRP